MARHAAATVLAQGLEERMTPRIERPTAMDYTRLSERILESGERKQ